MSYIGNKPANKAIVASDLDPAVITGQTALAVAPADTDEFLISDAGTLKRLDASLIGSGLDWQSTIVTGSTLTAEAGKGYWINTTSNICTITLPGTASVGDQIIFVDYAKTWGTNKIVIDSNGLNFAGNADTIVIEYKTSGITANIIYSGATKGWIPVIEDNTPYTYTGIFAFGTTGSNVNTINLVNGAGVIASDSTGAGSARNSIAAASYGGDKGIFGFGYISSNVSMTNLVTNEGVVAADVSGTGTARRTPGAASYGGDKAIFAFGLASGSVNTINLVDSSGVMASDSSGTGTARNGLMASSYDEDKAIFAFGHEGSYRSMSNLVSNSGVVASDTTGVGTARYRGAAASYGTDKAIMAFGSNDGGVVSMSNLVNSSGVVATDTTGVGTAREQPAALMYGGDKVIFGFGSTGSVTNVSNLVNSSGVVATDTTGVGTSRTGLGGCNLKGSV